MKRFMVILASAAMALSLAACTPTPQKDAAGQTRAGAPAGAEEQTTVDGAAEKLEQGGNPDEAPSVTVCIYTIKDDKSGLEQNMDAVDGEELDAQKLMDKLAELGTVEAGIKVQNFENKDGVLILDLSGLQGADDKLILASVANTFLQNYEGKELRLSVNGTAVSEEGLLYTKEYKTMGK